MNIGPSGITTAVAGSPLAQAKGANVERAHGEVGAQRRRVYHERKAEAAAGIGEPDGDDLEIADRTGDGRRPWEEPPEPEESNSTGSHADGNHLSQESGNLLDLNG
jgi:hypothetical protein